MINLHHQVFGRKYAGVATVGNNSTGFIGFISTRNGNVSVDWGDGAINNITTLKNVDFTNYPEGSSNGQIGHTYSSASIRDIKINLLNGFNDMYSLRFSSYYGSYDNMLYILDWGAFIKQFTNLYSFYYNVGNNTQTIKGDLSQIPNSLERIYIANVRLQNSTDLYLNLSNFSSASQLKYFSSPVSGTKNFQNIYGDLSKLPPLINYFLLAQNLANTLTYTAGRTWASSFDTLDIGNATMSYSDIDNLLNDMNNSITTAIGSKRININGYYSNTAAYNGLIAKGFTITGLVQEYKLEYNFNGNFNDTNGVNNLIPSGTVTFTTDRKGGNTAIQLGSGYLQTANNLPSSNVWSISFWVKNTTTDFKILFSLNNGITDAKQLQISINAVSQPSITISSPDSTQANYNQKTFPNTNQTSWNHIVIVFNRALSASEEIKLYKNGVLITSSSQSNYDQTGDFQNAKLTIGALYNGQYISASTMDDLEIYNRPLTQTEITNLYNK